MRFALDVFWQQGHKATSLPQVLRGVLALIADAEGGTRGCLFVNTVAELAPGDAELVPFAPSKTARVAALMTATPYRPRCPQADAAECAGAWLAMAMGVTTLRKTSVRVPLLTGLLAQASRLLPQAKDSPMTAQPETPKNAPPLHPSTFIKLSHLRLTLISTILTACARRPATRNPPEWPWSASASGCAGQHGRCRDATTKRCALSI